MTSDSPTADPLLATPPPAAVTDAAATIDSAAPPIGENTDRILRMFARFTSVGYLAYPLVLAGAIDVLIPYMADWWTPFALTITFGAGLLPGALSFHRDIRLMQYSAGAAAILFLVAAATWWPAWTGIELADNSGVWLAAFPGLASLAAIIAWPTAIAFAHLVIACIAVQIINLFANADATVAMLIPEIAFAIMFCTLFVGGAAMAMRTGRVLDATTDSTHRAAALAAAQRARNVERERIDALVHDSVLSTLLSISRGQPPTITAPLATSTLTELEDLRRNGQATAEVFTPDQAIAHLRAATAAADDQAAFSLSPTAGGVTEFPVDGIRAIGAAVAEALRNSRLHAGPDAVRAVTVELTDTGIVVDIIDDGVGFDPAAVAPHRLGITVSILGRTRALAGGTAQVHSRPGVGTQIHLMWEPA